LEERSNISPQRIAFQDSLSVDAPESGPYGVPHTFTLADSFYDAQANDVFLTRKEHPVSVVPVAQKLDNLSSPQYAQLATPPVNAPPVNAPPPFAAYTEPQPEALQLAPQLVPSPVQQVVTTKREYKDLSPEERIEESFRIPIVATLVFVVTMIAIYYMGGQVAGYYAPVIQGGKVEFVGRPQPAK